MRRLSRLLPAGLALAVGLSGCLTSSTTSSPGNRPAAVTESAAQNKPADSATAAGPKKATGAAPQDEKPAKNSQDAAKADLPDLGKAQEITGKDQDDKEFKLSDYRGKVVLLDFWGNW